MTDEQIAEIEARASAATEGPWIPKHAKTAYLADGTSEHEARSIATGETVAHVLDSRDGTQRGRDLKFIAAARSDIPALVAEVRRMRGLLASLSTADAPCEHCCPHCPWCSGKLNQDARFTHDADCPAFTPDGSVKT
jgi:hypothetical protein